MDFSEFGLKHHHGILSSDVNGGKRVTITIKTPQDAEDFGRNLDGKIIGEGMSECHIFIKNQNADLHPIISKLQNYNALHDLTISNEAGNTSVLDYETQLAFEELATRVPLIQFTYLDADPRNNRHFTPLNKKVDNNYNLFSNILAELTKEGGINSIDYDAMLQSRAHGSEAEKAEIRRFLPVLEIAVKAMEETTALRLGFASKQVVAERLALLKSIAEPEQGQRVEIGGGLLSKQLDDMNKLVTGKMGKPGTEPVEIPLKTEVHTDGHQWVARVTPAPVKDGPAPA